MNPIERLRNELITRLPQATVTLDVPKKRDGIWFLDAVLRGHHVAVRWKQTQGFGITADESRGYGEGADEVCSDVGTALDRVCVLLERRGRTLPPKAVRLRELREELGLSQEEIALRLGRR